MLGPSSSLVFCPRYIIFVTPFILLFAAYALSAIKISSTNYYPILYYSVTHLPNYPLIIDPIHFPYTNVDEGYVNGWSAGNGTKQIAD